MEADQATRFAIFKKICKYARDAKLGALVDPLARHVEENHASWGLDAAATRALLHDIFTMLSETQASADPNDAAARRVLKLQLAYLGTFGAGEKLDAAGEAVATAPEAAAAQETAEARQASGAQLSKGRSDL